MDRFVVVPGARLFVADDGVGPPIVLVHAAIANHHAWDPMTPLLVDAGYRAIRYDVRTIGQSPTADVEFSERADLIAVMDALGVDRATLVGNSHGGEIALETAIEFPGRVDALITVGTGIAGYDPALLPSELPYVTEAEEIQARGGVEDKADFEVRIWVDGPGQSPDRVDSSIRDAVRAMDLPRFSRDRVKGRPLALEPPAVGRLSELTCPTLAVAGELDFSDVVGTAHFLAAEAPNCRAEIVPGVAHMIGLEAPEILTGIIVEFRRSLGWARGLRSDPDEVTAG